MEENDNPFLRQRNENLPMREGDSVKLKTSFFDFNASGNNVIVMILLCAFIGGVFWFFGVYLRTHEDTTANLWKEMKEIKYILTLSDDEKKDLHIGMPESLRSQQTYLRK